MEEFEVPKSLLPPCTEELVIEICDSPTPSPVQSADDLVVDLGKDIKVELERVDDEDQYARSSVDELREMCRRRSLKVRGTKQELIQRLAKAG